MAGRPTSDDDAALSPEQYLEKHHVAYYLRDVVDLLLRARDERPLDFIADYFTEVLHGTHVLMREFSYVNRSSRDRWAFVASAREALADLDQHAPTTASALTQLLRLVCPDFPVEIVTDACRLCGDGLAAHPLERLLHATCVRLCFSDLLQRRVVEAFASCESQGVGLVERSAVGLALQRSSALSAAEERRPFGLFDELVTSSGTVSLDELQQELVHAPPMFALFSQQPGSGTLVTSPPPRGHEPFSAGSNAGQALYRTMPTPGSRRPPRGSLQSAGAPLCPRVGLLMRPSACRRPPASLSACVSVLVPLTLCVCLPTRLTRAADGVRGRNCQRWSTQCNQLAEEWQHCRTAAGRCGASLAPRSVAHSRLDREVH